MPFTQSSVAENSNSCRSFTISQVAPGALLHFDPPMHSKELAEALNAFIPGPFTLQEKQRQISSEFCLWRSMACPEGTASYFYDASPALEFSSFSSNELSFDESFSGAAGQTSFSTKESKPPARRSKASKVVKKTTPAKAVSSGPRLPGFSIMTKDGVDITDIAPRGPKTKEQREHAALMRKLQACPTCRKRKQRCNPSHHVQNSNFSSSASTKTSSPPSSSIESQSSTPASSTRTSPRQSQEMQIAQAGQRFNGIIPPPKTALTPSDFFPMPTFDMISIIPLNLNASDLSMDIVDPSFLDINMISAEFEPNFNEFIDNSVFDTWINYQEGSSSSNVPNQRGNVPGSALAVSPQTHTNSSSGFNGGDQFIDFVPAWGTGSKPYTPIDGSPLKSPEAFGVPADVSHFASETRRTEDRLHFGGGFGHTPNSQTNSLFAEYPASSFGSPDMMTPSSMTTSDSSQGFSSSMTRSSSSITNDRSSDMYSPVLLQSNTVPSSEDTSHGSVLMQPQHLGTGLGTIQPQHLDTGLGTMQPQHLDTGLGTIQPQHLDTGLGTIQPQHISTGLGTLQPQHVRSGHTPVQSTSSLRSLEAQAVITPPVYDGGDLSTLAQLQFGLGNGHTHNFATSDEYEQRRMAPAIQSSRGPHTEQRFDSSENTAATVDGTNDKQQHICTESNISPDQLRLKVLRQHDQRRTNARRESIDPSFQSLALAVIPQEQHNRGEEVIPQLPSRPFRFSQVEDTSSLLIGEIQISSSAGGMAKKIGGHQHSSVLAHQEEAAISSHAMQTQNQGRNGEDTILDLSTGSNIFASRIERIHTETRRQAGVISRPSYASSSNQSELWMRQPEALISDASSSLEFQLYIGLGLLILASCVFGSSIFGTTVMSLLICSVLPKDFSCQQILDMLKLESATKKATEHLELPCEVRSNLVRSHPSRRLQNSLEKRASMSRSHWLKSILSCRTLV